MAIQVIVRPDAEEYELPGTGGALDDTVPDARTPFDAEELDDTQPRSAGASAEEEFSEAPTLPDVRVVIEHGRQDPRLEQLVRAVAQAVRRVFSHPPG